MRSACTRLLVPLALISALACTRHAPSQASAHPERDVITREQILENRFATAWEAIDALRTNWLQTRGTNSMRNPGEVLVYLDDNRLGGVETLRTYPTTNIMYIRYFDRLAATARWGVDHTQGVIVISTRY
jgi:hypothetical protein